MNEPTVDHTQLDVRFSFGDQTATFYVYHGEQIDLTVRDLETGSETNVKLALIDLVRLQQAARKAYVEFVQRPMPE